MKRVVLFILSIELLFAFPPNGAYFNNLLINDGKVIKNTLKVNEKREGYIYFDGEIQLTGIIERSDNYEEGVNYSALRFYPDHNVDLPFHYDSAGFSINIKDLKKFQRLHFGVLLDDKNINLPEPLNKRFFGVSAVRAEITMKNYHFYGEGEAGYEAYGNIVSFKALGKIKTEYFNINDCNVDDYNVNDCRKLYFNSKDDYINIRDKANGNIIGKILKEDMNNNNAILLFANGDGIDYMNLENLEKEWIEVFYFPPGVSSGKDAIYGFVHGSQVEVRIDTNN